MHVYGLWWIRWKLLMYDLSLYINSLETMAISFFCFFHGPSCVHIFFLFFQHLDLHVSIFFFWIALLFYLTIIRERDQHILWSIYCVEWMDGTMLTSHRSIARGMWCARESWSWKHENNSLKGHNNLTKLNAKSSNICVYGF